jgi:hypothetical protein
MRGCCGAWQVLSWDELELKDHVQVKDATMNIYSNAVIVAIHTEGTYDVLHDVSERHAGVRVSEGVVLLTVRLD